MILPFLPFGTPLNFMNKRKRIILMHKSVATADLCAKCRQHTLVPVFPSDFHMLIVGVSSAKNWGHCSGLIYARVLLQLNQNFPIQILSLGHLSYLQNTGLQANNSKTAKFWSFTPTIYTYFNQSYGSRPVECDVIGWKKCSYSSREQYTGLLVNFESFRRCY